MNRILIVEDEKFLRDILKRYLESEGYDVTEAEDGEKAFLIAKEHC